jgi:glutamine phosphoribosylpyrophosphate amidotransferase
MVFGDKWEEARNSAPFVALCHARKAYRGDPSDNINNHPFVSEPMGIGVIHNGLIPDKIYDSVKKTYPTESECDSEVILRLLESQNDLQKAVKQAWGVLEGSYMAVAVGRITEAGGDLMLFRNEHRTLWVADVRKKLGQVFFFSTKEIWEEATDGILSVEPEIVTPGTLRLFEVRGSEISGRVLDLDR